jgi:membrane-associated phospholipid phosphatase
MHLAEVMLLALASRPISRTWFRWNLGIVAVMLFGSVVTGFHYLIDGYAGIALAVLAWWAGNRIYSRTRPVRISPAASI